MHTVSGALENSCTWRFLNRLKGEVELESRDPAVSQDFVHDGHGRVQKVASTEHSELLVQILVKAEEVTTSNNLFVTAGGSVASQAPRMGEAIVTSGSM